MYVLPSPVKTWIFNKGFNLSFQLLAAVAFDVFALLPSVVFSYLFHHFSVAQIPPGCVCMHLAVGREGKEESHFFPPSGYCFDFPKLLGGSCCVPAEGSVTCVVSVLAAQLS